MPYKVRDDLEISLIINSKEYPISEGNTLNFLHMASSTKFLLPTLHFSVIDITGSMAKVGLADAVPIQIIISSSGVTTSRNFRLLTWVNPPGSQTYMVDGFWDSPQYRVGTTDKAIKGTSSSVLESIAATCGLSYAGTYTNDAQLWVPRNRTYGQFAAYIASYGYLNDQAHMVSAVDLQGTLRYVNARSVDRAFEGINGQAPSGSAYRVQEYEPQTNAGFNNAVGGYRNTRVGQSIFESSNLESLAFQPKAKLLMNASVRDTATRGVFSYSPIDFGNTHANFQKARYQNSRFNSLLSMGCSMLIANPTLMDILDEFNFTCTDATYSGSYVWGLAQSTFRATLTLRNSLVTERAYRELSDFRFTVGFFGRRLSR